MKHIHSHPGMERRIRLFPNDHVIVDRKEWEEVNKILEQLHGKTALPTGEQLRDKGIERSMEHAEAVDPGWKEKARRFLIGYLKTAPVQFMTEDVRIASEGFVSEPPDARSWGGIVRKAYIDGLITKNGFGISKNPRAHRDIRQVWKVVRK